MPVPADETAASMTTVETIPASALVGALPHPVILVDAGNVIRAANDAAEAFFSASLPFLQRRPIDRLLPFGSPLLALLVQVRERGAPIAEYRIDLSSPRLGPDRIVDLFAAPVPEIAGGVVVMLQPRTMADKMDRQLTSRGAAGAGSGRAALHAHEIKNPLAGIRGAAQLLEPGLDEDDRALARLITDEADRIVKLVDRMEVFGDERPVERAPVNIHVVLDHVKRLARSSFAAGLEIVEEYDPSLPPVHANRDQLVQVFLNLVKNAADALEDRPDGVITLTSAFRPGMRVQAPGSADKISLPLEFCVRDNGPGVPDDLKPYLFEPFVTTKRNGVGLGLALVAKIIGDHGGVIECDSHRGGTTFRILLPAYAENPEEAR